MKTLPPTSAERIRRKQSRAKVSAIAMANPIGEGPQQRCMALLDASGHGDLKTDFLAKMREQLATGTLGLDEGERWNDDKLTYEFAEIAKNAKRLSPEALVRQLVNWTLKYQREVDRRQTKRPDEQPADQPWHDEFLANNCKAGRA